MFTRDLPTLDADVNFLARDVVKSVQQGKAPDSLSGEVKRPVEEDTDVAPSLFHRELIFNYKLLKVSILRNIRRWLFYND